MEDTNHGIEVAADAPTTPEVAPQEPAPIVATPEAQAPSENVPEPVATPADVPSETPEETFARGYRELCEKTGYLIKVKPVFEQEDNGSFSVRVESQVVKNS